MILALDLGTTCGFAVGGTGQIVWGTQVFKNDRYSGGGMRFLRFRRWLDEIAASGGITEVVFEEVRRHAGTDAAHVYGGLMGTLTAFCEEKGIPYEGVPVAAIKKYAAGKGNASKPEIIAAVKAWGRDVEDDNQADAVALLYLRLAQRSVVGPVPAKAPADLFS